MGSDAFRPRTPFISCSSLLRSDARMVDLYRVSTGVEQSSGDLHRAPVHVSPAVFGGTMVGRADSIRAASQVKEDANAKKACTRPFDGAGGWDSARNRERCPSASSTLDDCSQRARWRYPAGPIRSRLRDWHRRRPRDSLSNRSRTGFRLGTVASLRTRPALSNRPHPWVRPRPRKGMRLIWSPPPGGDRETRVELRRQIAMLWRRGNELSALLFLSSAGEGEGSAGRRRLDGGTRFTEPGNVHLKRQDPAPGVE